MKNLTAPKSLNPIKIFWDITKAKKKQDGKTLRSCYCISFVNTRYREYFKKRRNLEMIIPLTSYDIHSSLSYAPDALKRCYEIETIPLKELKKEIYKLYPTSLGHICQYCGVNVADTIDHFLPKETFYEYSVFPINLIPSCYSCNNAKRGFHIDQQGKRMIINLYYDDFVSKPFLEAKLINAKSKFPKIEFSLNPNSLSEDEFAIIKNHFKNLKLYSLYGKVSNKIIATVNEDLNNSYFNNQSQIKRILMKQYDHYEKLFGVNNWQAVIYRTLANSPVFISKYLHP